MSFFILLMPLLAFLLSTKRLLAWVVSTNYLGFGLIIKLLWQCLLYATDWVWQQSYRILHYPKQTYGKICWLLMSV
ncbi:MAG: hypothetical protein ABL933_01635 [Methyloglobulus sp.]